MRKILLLFIFTSPYSFISQNFQFSRAYPIVSKNLPVVILNHHASYFHVLRDNKLAHDFTVERRAKPGAEILNFTPLKLDSINANWFDYSNLDYLFYEHQDKIYFVFEKITNAKKSLYLKIIDTLGKSSGFIEIISIDRDKNMLDFDIDFKKTYNNNVLVTTAVRFYNESVRKSIFLFDSEKKKIIWIKKLPIENNFTGYSACFECSPNHDLYYLMIKSKIVGYERKYANHMQVNQPVFFFDSVILHRYSASQTISRSFLAGNLSHLNSMSIQAGPSAVFAQLHCSKQENANDTLNTFFLTFQFNPELRRLNYHAINPLKKSIRKQLTFYDGTDFEEASDKNYKSVNVFFSETHAYSISERKEPNYYKELLVWKTNLINGEVNNQYIIPRKLFSSETLNRYSHFGEVTAVMLYNTLYVYLLEAKSDFEDDPNEFEFKRMKKRYTLNASNLVLYAINEKSTLQKKLLYANSEFDFIPIPYQSENVSDLLIYLSSGKQEKFAILNLNQL